MPPTFRHRGGGGWTSAISTRECPATVRRRVRDRFATRRGIPLGEGEIGEGVQRTGKGMLGINSGIRWGIVGLLCGLAWAGNEEPRGASIVARIIPERLHVNIGEPIRVQFLIENWSSEPAVLFVPGTEPKLSADVMGLPIEHVFSGEAFAGLMIRNEQNRQWNVAVNYQPPATSPVVTVGPRSSVGTMVDIRGYYTAFKSPGVYRIQWQPYGGVFQSNPVVINVSPLKQAEILTDQGKMLVRFFYEEAPRHIDNFIELAKSGFYDNLTFHRIESGFFLQGGCPNGDGTGIRPDGVKIKSELSTRPQTRGKVSMALLDDDPDSASCQFFITNTDVPEWNGRYCVFGELTGDESFATLDKLMSAATDEQGRPSSRLEIRGVRIVDAPREGISADDRP